MDVTYHIHQYTNIISELRVEVKRLRVKLDQQAMAHNNASAIQAIQSKLDYLSKFVSDICLGEKGLCGAPHLCLHSRYLYFSLHWLSDEKVLETVLLCKKERKKKL